MCGLLAAGCGRDHRRRCHRADSEPPCRLSGHSGARTPPRLVLPLPALCGRLPPNASHRHRCATPGNMAGISRRRGCTTHYALVAERSPMPAADTREELSGDLCRPPHPHVSGQTGATALWMAHDRRCLFLLTARFPIIAPGTPLLTSPCMQLSFMITDEVILPVPKLEPDMPYYDVLWNYEDADGNVAHIAEHGLTPEDVNAVLLAPDETGVSRSSGRPIAFGYTPAGRYICVVYEEIDAYTLYPVTAF